MRHFRYKNLQELEQDARRLGASSVLLQEDADRVRAALSRAVDVGPVRAGNSMAIHPMEGCDGTLDGAPGELTWRRYERFARGGAKLIWFEATAVRSDARANVRQLAIHEGNVDEFARLYEAMRRWHGEEWGNTDDLLIPIQLTHSGRFSTPVKTIAWHQPQVDQRTMTPADLPVISDDELERLEDDFLRAAKFAYRAGFRCFDIKATHGYLLAELLDAKERGGRYGGSIKNRTRLVRNVMGKVRAALGGEVVLAMRLGCFAGVPFVRNAETGLGEPLPYSLPYRFGFGVNPLDPLQPDTSEVKQAISLFKQAGLQLLNISVGCPYYNPHYGRPYEKPDEGNYEAPEHPLLGVDRHLRIAGELQRAFPDLPMAGTGYSWLQGYAAHAAAQQIETGAIRFFGYGRGALAYPDFARAILETGRLDQRRVCQTLTYCTYLMRRKDHPLGQWPTGCPPYDKEGYGEIMKEARAVQRGEKLVELVATP